MKGKVLGKSAGIWDEGEYRRLPKKAIKAHVYLYGEEPYCQEGEFYYGSGGCGELATQWVDEQHVEFGHGITFYCDEHGWEDGKAEPRWDRPPDRAPAAYLNAIREPSYVMPKLSAGK